MTRNLGTTTGAVLALLLAGNALAGTTPAQKCESDKNKLAGQYDSCRQKVESKFALTGDAAARTAALQKCLTKYNLKWPLTESKAGGACPSNGDQTAIAGTIDTTTTNIATALAGGALVDCPGDLLACQSDLGTCNSSLTTAQASLTTCTGNLGTCNTSLTTCQNDLTTCQATPQGQRLKTGQTQCWDPPGNVISCAGTGQDGELQKGLARAYVDNGDGTITDTQTGLMWEKLSDDGSIHDKDNQYNFPNAFASKIASLNGGGGFAGHTDWRVPNVNELQSLANYGAVGPAVSPAFNTGCAPACTVLTCSCTQSNNYWSSSTYQFDPAVAWYVVFTDGQLGETFKLTSYHVRAVRGGS